MRRKCAAQSDREMKEGNKRRRQERQELEERVEEEEEATELSRNNLSCKMRSEQVAPFLLSSPDSTSKLQT